MRKHAGPVATGNTSPLRKEIPMTTKRYQNRIRMSRPRASSTAPPRSRGAPVSFFDAVTAFENVRGDLGDVEALAQAAFEHLDALPGGPHEKRREIGRLFAFVDFTARAAREALDRAELVHVQIIPSRRGRS